MPSTAPTPYPAGLRTAVRALLCMLALLLSACGSLPSMPARTASHALPQPQSTPLGQMVQAQRTAADTPYGSGFVLLGGADAAFASRLALVEAATQTLDLQYYAIHADPSTRHACCTPLCRRPSAGYGCAYCWMTFTAQARTHRSCAWPLCPALRCACSTR